MVVRIANLRRTLYLASLTRHGVHGGLGCQYSVGSKPLPLSDRAGGGGGRHHEDDSRDSRDLRACRVSRVGVYSAPCRDRNAVHRPGRLMGTYNCVHWKRDPVTHRMPWFDGRSMRPQHVRGKPILVPCSVSQYSMAGICLSWTFERPIHAMHRSVLNAEMRFVA